MFNTHPLVRSIRSFWIAINNPIAWLAGAIGGYVLLNAAVTIVTIYPSTASVVSPLSFLVFVATVYCGIRLGCWARLLIGRRRT